MSWRPDPAGGAHDAPPDLLVGWGGGLSDICISCVLTTFDQDDDKWWRRWWHDDDMTRPVSKPLRSLSSITSQSYVSVTVRDMRHSSMSAWQRVTRVTVLCLRDSAWHVWHAWHASQFNVCVTARDTCVRVLLTEARRRWSTAVNIAPPSNSGLSRSSPSESVTHRTAVHFYVLWSVSKKEASVHPSKPTLSHMPNAKKSFFADVFARFCCMWKHVQQ